MKKFVSLCTVLTLICMLASLVYADNGKLTGTVKDASTNAALSGVTIKAGSYTTTTNSYGSYSLNLPRATYTVTASKTGYSSKTLSATVSSGRTTYLNFSLSKATTTNGTLTGTVRNASTSAAISGATVAAGSSKVTTNSSGVYTISLPAGGYSVTASASGYTSKTATAGVTSGQTTTLNISLSKTTTSTNGTLTGTVRNASTSAAISGATVTAGSATTTTNSSGVYTLSLAAGSYTVSASASGYTAKSSSASVTSGATTTLNISLSGGTTTSGNYTVIARNDLGMHCACPTFAGFLLLPPYNTLRVQVVQRGSSPSIVSSGITVSYSLAEETDVLLQTDPYFSQWITYSPMLFPGFQPVVNGKVQGLAGYGITGNATYDSQSMSYIAKGIPAYPVTTGDTTKDIMIDPLGGPNRDPFITANITVKNSSGTVVGSTSTVVPVAFGGCCSCHLKLAAANGYPNTPAGSFAYLGKLHGQNSSKIDFNYLDPTGRGTAGPIRCSWCHWDPAMGEAAAPGLPAVWPNYVIMPGASFTKADVKVSQYSFSDVLHRFHSQDNLVLTQYDPNIASNCYDCHPGNGVNCYRGAHKAKTAIWCTDCHGNLNQRVAAGQLTQPWQASTLPSCFAPAKGITSAFSCHATVNQTVWTSGFGGNYINARGGMGNLLLCESCHGSAHSESPSALAADNVQNAAIHTSLGTTFPSGKDNTYALGSCNVCHTNQSNTWSSNVMNAGD